MQHYAHQFKFSKYLFSLSAFYITIKLMTILLIYKIISIGPYHLSVSTLIMPFWFFVGDIVTEVYGYKTTRALIWSAIICQVFFALVCSTMVQLPSANPWPLQDAYTTVFSRLPRVACASVVAIIVGAFVNAYALSRWKILLSGKWFWLRSIGSAFLGELTFTVVGFIIEFAGVVPSSELTHLIISSVMMKVIVNFFATIPASFIASFLKRKEQIDVYDFDVNFNPFRI